MRTNRFVEYNHAFSTSLIYPILNGRFVEGILCLRGKMHQYSQSKVMRSLSLAYGLMLTKADWF